MKKQITTLLLAFFTVVLLPFGGCSKENDPPAQATGVPVATSHITMGLKANTSLPHFLSITKGTITLINDGYINAGIVDVIVTKFETLVLVAGPTGTEDTNGWSVKRGTTFHYAGNNDERWFNTIAYNGQIKEIVAGSTARADMYDPKVGDCYVVETEDNLLALFRISKITGNSAATNGSIDFDVKIQN